MPPSLPLQPYYGDKRAFAVPDVCKDTNLCDYGDSTYNAEVKQAMVSYHEVVVQWERCCSGEPKFTQ